MDLEKLEYYEFLDLSDIGEDEKQQLKQTLFSEGTLDFLQLPWTNQITSEEWQKRTYDSETPVPNAPPGSSSSPHDALVGQNSGPPVAQPMQPVTMYSSPTLPNYSMPPPSTGYQHPQNVFVSNVTANVHGNMPGHYVQQHYTMPEPTEISGRGHRGRGRSRGNKRNECRMESTMVETTSTQQYAPQYVPLYYHPAYYTQPMGSPIQHPNQQHAPASPLYITSMYSPMYGAYHPPGPQYYTPPTAHVNAVMEDTPDITELSLGHNTEENSVYQHQINEDDFEANQSVVTTVIVNSNMETCDPDVRRNNSSFLNNNHVKDTEYLLSDTQCNIKPVSKSICVATSAPVTTTSVVSIKNEPNSPKISANLTTFNESNVITNIYMNSVEQRKVKTEPDTVTIVPKIVPLQTLPAVDLTLVHKTMPTELKITKVVSLPIQETVSVKDVPQEPVQMQPPSNKSWASLFSSKSFSSAEYNSSSDLGRSSSKPISESYKTEEDKQIGSNLAELTSAQKSIYTNDPLLYRMGEFLSKYTLDNRTVSLQPRGLTNRSNYCYINSILQALLACPPFYNLLKALPHQTKRNSSGKSPTPIIESMVEFVNEFMQLSAGARLNRKEKGQRKDDTIDVLCGSSFEPSWIYKILNGIRSDTFIVEGRQEDAEEFFGCLLNGLNDEMLELMKLTDAGSQSNNKNLSNGDIVSNGDTNDQNEDEWKIMGPKNKGSITRKAEFDRSPISDIFRGQLRSRVHRTNSRSQDQITDNVQPFFTLQLDIEKTNSVTEALEVLVHKDKLEGVTCSKTNQQVEAWQQVTVEELPLVMVLHLKCFNYKLDVCSKIIKALEFPIDLKIDSKLLSAKIKYTGKQKQYKLFAVVYHDGKEASKGHYLTDAYHVGYGGWIRYDDSTVKSVNETHVLHPSGARVPYLLFYRRCDTIGNQLNTKKD